MNVNHLIKEFLTHNITLNELQQKLGSGISHTTKTMFVFQNTAIHHFSKKNPMVPMLTDAISQYQYMVASGVNAMGNDIQDYLSHPKTDMQIDRCPQIDTIAELGGLDVDDIMYLGQYAQNIWVGVILDKGDIERYFLIKDTRFVMVQANSNDFVEFLMHLIDYLKIHIKEQVMYTFATLLKQKIQNTTIRIGDSPKANECYDIFTICDVYIASKNTAIRVKPTIMVGGEFIELDDEVIAMMICNDDLSIGFDVNLNNNSISNLVRTY